MSHTRTMVRTVAMLAGIPAVVSASAFMHAKLRSAIPAAGSTVDAPKELRLTFSEKIELKVAKITLLHGSEDGASLGPITAESNAPETVIIPVTKPLTAGSYTVKYRVSGPDGHPMGGAYSFRVK